MVSSTGFFRKSTHAASQAAARNKKYRRQRLRQLIVEPLEDRRMLALTITSPPVGEWISAGPEGIANGQLQGVTNETGRINPTTGAVRAIGVQADNPATPSFDESGIVYVGSVNGGVWRTTNIFENNVNWTPQSDNLPSSAIGAIAISPVNGNVVYAGTGKFSSFSSVSAPPVGIYRTLDGNNLNSHPTWVHLDSMLEVGDPTPKNIFDNSPITSIALSPIDANVVLVATAGARPGLFRSTDAGANWTYLSGAASSQLPIGTVTDLAYAPGSSTVFAAAITNRRFTVGTKQIDEANNYDLLVSVDGGATWKSTNSLATRGGGDVDNIRISVQDSGSTTIVYSGVVKEGKLSALGRLVWPDLLPNVPQVGTWTAMTLPPNIHPGEQGGKHFSIASSPSDPNRLLLGGDTQKVFTNNGCSTYGGNLQLGIFNPNTNSANNTDWEAAVCSNANGSMPHADSRDMEFIPGHPDILLQSDDGGIYALTGANTDDSLQWVSKIGNLQLGEVGSVAYNTIDNRILAGLQDNAIIQQNADGSWSAIQQGVKAGGTPYYIGGDGIQIIEDPAHPRQFKALINNASFIFELEYSASGELVDLEPANTDLARNAEIKKLSKFDKSFSGAAEFKLEYHNSNPSRLFLGFDGFYELLPGKKAGTYEAVTIEKTSTKTHRAGKVTAFSVGTTSEPDVAYVARFGSIAVRRPGEKTLTPSLAAGDKYCDGRTTSEATTGFITGNAFINDIKINPDNWQEAYAVGFGEKVFQTVDGGLCWRSIPVPAGHRPYSLEIVNPSSALGDEILVVGTDDGVMRSRRDDGKIIGFTGVASGIPNVIVYDMQYDSEDQLLIAGTLGRGVWTLPNALEALKGVTIVQGTTDSEVISLELVTSNGKPKISVSLDGQAASSLIDVERYGIVRVNGAGGEDRIVIDNSLGYLGEALANAHSLVLEVSGGEDPLGVNDPKDKILILPPPAIDSVVSIVSTSFSESGTIELRSTNGGNDVTIKYEGFEEFENQVSVDSFDSLGVGLQAMADQLSGLAGSTTDGLEPELLSMLNAQRQFKDEKLLRTFAPDAAARHIGDAAYQNSPSNSVPFLRRLIESGKNGFQLSEIGKSITTNDQLRIALDALDDVQGNVLVSTLSTSNGLQTRFDIGIQKSLFGAVVLDAVAQSNSVSLEVSAELYADVQARFVIGFDDLGFFIDPNPVDANGDSLGPEIVIRNIRGSIRGDAILGPIEVEVSNGQLVTDSDLRLEMNLALPTNDTSSDGLLRIRSFLNNSINDLVQVELVGDPLDATPEISISADFSLSAFTLEDLVSTSLTLEWPDASNLRAGLVRLTDTTSSSRILNFLNTHLDDVVAGIKTIAGSLEQATGIDLLEKKLPLIDKTLGELLNNDPEPLVLDASNIATLSNAILDEDDRVANIGVTQLNLLRQGVEVGNLVEYQTVSGVSLTKAVTEVSLDSFSFEFSSLPDQAPASTSTFRIQRDGGLASRLKAIFGSVDFEIPTFQQMIRELERITGTELMDRVKLIGTPGASDFAIHIPLEIDPDPLRYVLPLSFKDKLPNLTLDAAAKLELTVAPHFNVTIGVSLAKNKPDGSPIGISERVYIVASKDDITPPTGSPQPTGTPIVALDISARLNDPELHGQFGFLNVKLAENRQPGAPTDNPSTPIDEDGNGGIQFSLHTTLDLQDPDSGVADQRITLVDLATKLTNTVKFGINGDLDIDGLKVIATVGPDFELGNVTISLDGSGPNTNGHIDSFDDFARILTNRDTGIQINGELTVLESFNNITAEQVFAALDFLIAKLRDLGVGTALDKPIPLLNRSVSELVDLGEAFSKTIGKPESPNAISNAQALEDFINLKLGNPNPPISVDVTRDGIEFNFKLSHRFLPLTLPLAFTVGDNGLSISGDGNLSVNACVAMDLTLGLSNKAGLAFFDRVYINVGKKSTPELAFELLVNAGYNVVSQCGNTNVNAQGAIDFAAAVGPLALEIEDARVLLDLEGQVNLVTPATDGHVTISNILSTSIVPSFSGSIQGIIPIDGNNDGSVVSLPAAGSPDARVEFAGRIDSIGNVNFAFVADPSGGNDIPHQPNAATPLSDLQLTAISGSLGTIKVVSHNLTGLISNNFLNFGSLIEGLEKLIDWVDRVFGRDILDRKIPFIGKSIGDALNFLESDKPGAKSFRSVINSILTNRKGTDGTDSLAANLSDAAVQKAIDIISDAIFSIGNVVPPIDRNGDGLKNARDLAFQEIVDGKTVGATFQFKYQPKFSYLVPFDLGLDFLDFNSTGSVTVEAGLELNLGFGINKTEGFFFLLDPSAPEFSITTTVAAELETSAKLGFLNVMANLQKGTNMSASFTADISSPTSNNRLRFSDLINPSTITQLIPRENLKVNVEAHVIAALSTSVSSELPAISSVLVLDWGKPDETQLDKYSSFDLLVEAIKPEIALRSIQLDVGSFVTSIVKPIFQKISELNLLPEGLLNALNTEIPLIDKTAIELLRDVLKPEQQATFDLVFSIASFIQDAGTIGNDAADKRLVIHFPDIVIGQDDEDPNSAEPIAVGSDTVGTITEVGQSPKPLPADEKDESGNTIPGSGLPVVGNLLKRLGDMGITFPALRLSNLMQMLVGNELDIVLINVPRLELKKDFNVSFPLIGGNIGSIAELAFNAFVSGGFTFAANISGGFDTSGLKNGRFLDGFYLGDFDPGENGQIDPSDEERPEIEFTGYLQAGIEGSAKIAGFELGQISGYFKLEAGIGIELNDDNEVNGLVPICDLRPEEERKDGKLHVGEMNTIKNSHGGAFLSNFELTGNVTAELGVHILILGGLILDRTETVKFELLKFDGGAFPVKCIDSGDGGEGGGSCSSGPNLGDLNFDLNTGTYQVELPPSDNKDFREIDDLLISAEDLNGNPTDGIEIGSYVDSVIGISVNLGIVQIAAMGDSIDFLNDGILVGQGATITVNGQLTQGVVTNVTSNAIQVRPLNLGNVRLARSSGDGEPFSGLKINSGLETIVLEGRGNVERLGPSQCGQNHVDESKGQVSGVTTSDEEKGLGDEDNTLTISGNIRVPVKIKGGKGNDRIQGGAGSAEFHGGLGNDVLLPGSGPIQFGRTPTIVKLFGGPGKDMLRGGRGNDVLVGGPGNDTIQDGPSGNGVPFGLSGNDQIVGGGGGDRIFSSDGDDIVVGDYDEILDPRPLATRDQAEGPDSITSKAGGKTLIFSANHGTQPNQRGVAPATGKSVGDRVSSADPSDEIFAEQEDRLESVNQAAIIRIQARQQSVILTPTSYAIGTGRSSSVAPNAKIEISDSNGIVSLLGTDQNDVIKISRSATGHVFSIANRSSVTILGTVVVIQLSTGGGSDTVQFDFSQGNPLPVSGVSFDGGSPGTSGDTLQITGDTISPASVAPSNRLANAGNLTIGTRQISYANVGKLYISRIASLTWNSPGGTDVLAIGNSTFGKDAVTSIASKSRFSNGSILFDNVSTLNINTGLADSTTIGDQVIFSSIGFAVSGLKNVLVTTGPANDTINIPIELIALPVAGGSFTVDGGTGLDSLVANGNVDMLLNGDLRTLSNSNGNTIQLQNMDSENVRLIGGAANNRFTVTNWTGNTNIDGAAGSDLLLLSMRGGSLTAIDTLTLAGNVTTTASSIPATVTGSYLLGTSTRTLSVANGTATPDLIWNGSLGGSVGVSKTGLGSVQFLQPTGYTGTTTISAGELILQGAQGNGAVTVNGGTLSGSASIGSLTVSSGEVNPGLTTGIANVRGPMVLSATSQARFQINGTQAGSIASGYDILDVDGTVNLGGSSLIATFGFSSAIGNKYTIIDNDGTDVVLGTFAGLTEGSQLVASGFTLAISYRGGTGNDVTLTHVLNRAPAFQNRTITPQIDEGGEVVISGRITEPDEGDLFTLLVDWADGTGRESFQFNPANGLDVSVRHRFADNPNQSDDNPINVFVLWQDQHGASNSTMLQTRVRNTAPTSMTSLDVPSLQRGRVLGTGRFEDRGSDSWTGTVDYGDGSGEQVLHLASDRTFTLNHVYSTPGVFQVLVVIEDDDRGLGESRTPVRIESDGSQLYGVTWNNPNASFDVDADGFISPLDVLLIINEANTVGFSNLMSRVSEFNLLNPLYFDTNSDGFLSPLDALIVINYLNGRIHSIGEGESVVSATMPQFTLSQQVANRVTHKSKQDNLWTRSQEIQLRNEGKVEATSREIGMNETEKESVTDFEQSRSSVEKKIEEELFDKALELLIGEFDLMTHN